MATLLKSVDMKRGLPPNRKAIAVVFLITGIISVLFWWKGRDTKTAADPGSSATSTGWLEPLKISYVVDGKDSPKDTARQTTKLVSELQEKLAGAIGQYGIYVYRLDDKKGYGLGEEETMPAASIMKVPIMVATYRAIEAGDLEDTQEIKTLLTAMGKRSDNDAPVVLINKIGRPFMRETVTKLGMKNSDFDANTTTAYDVAEMWRRIVSEKIITSEHKDRMWADLQDSIFEERIPAGVPEDVDVVHKVGTDMDIWADAGVVLSSRPFVLVILNKGANLPQAQDLVPQLVRMIWSLESTRAN